MEERYLIEPDWCEEKRVETLSRLGGKKLKTSECISIIGRAASPEVDWCTRALDTILKWIEKAPMEIPRHRIEDRSGTCPKTSTYILH